MKRLEPVLERQIAAAEGRWRWLRFWQWLSLLVAGTALALLVLGLAALRGLLSNPAVAAIGILLVLLAGVTGLVTIIAAAAATRRPRPWLAAALERVWEPFLDRLNTLVFLEGRRDDPAVAPYFRRIERQARIAVPLGGLPFPFSRRALLGPALCALVLLAGTAAFYVHFEPWRRLGWDEEVVAVAPRGPELPPLEPPKESVDDARAPWGEVRITEPGRDLKVTKLDVVPLQVEAAADQPLKKAAWFTAANGGERKEHALPPPPEPNYAVYKPLLYVDEMGLSDWDLLSYYAAAHTGRGSSFASEVYFLEVRPFREDVLKMPGGEGGRAYRGLNELTGLIDRQRQILRETHRYNQDPQAKAELRRQDRGKLAEAEAELGTATRHLYAKLASEMENQAIGDVLTHLASAEKWVGRAREALGQDAPDAIAKEQGALAELVATRKSFQKAVSDHPEAFGEGGSDDGDEPTPVAELPDKLKQILELRDEQKAARELVQKTLDEQRRIASAVRSGGPGAYEGLAEDEQKAAQPLRDLQSGQPRAFKGAEREAAGATAAMQTAAEALRRKDAQAPETAAEAAQKLEELRRALGTQQEAADLTHAYRLKELLDRQARQMGRMQEEPGKFSGGDAQQAAADAKATTRELKKAVDEKPVRDAFGPGLGQALSGRPQQDLEKRLDALAAAGSEQERGQAAGAAKEGLERISKAFAESQPPAVKDLEADRLSPGEQEALERALRQLEGLLAEGKHALSPEDEKRQRDELMLNLRRGMKGRFGESPRAARLLLRVEDALAKDLTPVEKAGLKKLLDEIEQVRAETSDARTAKPGETVTHVDPSRLPAAYRDRIQRYFRKLSERP